MNPKVLAVIGGGGALLTTSAWAGITISAPSQHNVPKYWSGTNCRAYISAAATGGDSIASAHVSISDGTTVLEETQTYPYPPYRVYSAFAYMFDSTQFVTGSTVTVQLEAWTLNGTKYTGSYSSKVKNYATLAELTAMSEGPSSQHGKAALAQGLGLIGL